MPEKQTDNTPSQTTVKLLAFLLENERFYKLGELASRFDVSKQTILRILDRGDFNFFGKLIKEKQGKEVAYMIDKSSLLERLMRARPQHAEHGRCIPTYFPARATIKRKAVPDDMTAAVLERLGCKIG